MKKKVWLVVLLLSVIVIMPTNVSNAITRKVIITKSDFKKIGYADVVVEWGLIFTDSCGAATVATDENYPNASVYVQAVKDGVVKKTMSATGQIRACLNTPLKCNCDQFVSVHKLRSNKKTYSLTMRT